MSALPMGHVPLDIDVFTMDNSGTKKKGVSRTYQGYDGYAPIAAYLALEGWLLEIEHREGSQHSQKNFVPFLARVLHKALALTAAPLLVRLDSAHDAWETRIELEGWWTTLDLSAEKIIALYQDHGTSEQFHSELKTDMDLERLPSGKFEVNSLVMSCAALAYNILRYIGQLGLLGDKTPVRHGAKRRRLKTVMQELMYLAARLIETGRRLRLRFSRHSGLNFEAFAGVYRRLAYG